MVEQSLEPIPTKSRRMTMERNPKPVENTKFGGLYGKMGAQSLTGREATDVQMMGADNLGLLMRIKDNESGRLPGEFRKTDQNA